MDTRGAMDRRKVRDATLMRQSSIVIPADIAGKTTSRKQYGLAICINSVPIVAAESRTIWDLSECIVRSCGKSGSKNGSTLKHKKN